VTVCQFEIWLANLNPQKRPNEVGKTRPVVIVQSDVLNATAYPTVVVMPMTTDLIDGAEPLRMRIKAREKLQKDSDILVAQIRAIDKSRLKEKLATLSVQEGKRIMALLQEILD